MKVCKGKKWNDSEKEHREQFQVTDNKEFEEWFLTWFEMENLNESQFKLNLHLSYFICKL